MNDKEVYEVEEEQSLVYSIMETAQQFLEKYNIINEIDDPEIKQKRETIRQINQYLEDSSDLRIEGPLSQGEFDDIFED
jgi:hypothetical protein